MDVTSDKDISDKLNKVLLAKIGIRIKHTLVRKRVNEDGGRPLKIVGHSFRLDAECVSEQTELLWLRKRGRQPYAWREWVMKNVVGDEDARERLLSMEFPKKYAENVSRDGRLIDVDNYEVEYAFV